MRGPPNEKGPAMVGRGHDEAAGVTEAFDREQSYIGLPEKATAVCTEPKFYEPRYEAGWMPNYDDMRQQGYAAFLRPYHEGWYDLFYVDNWMDAVAKALEITRETPDCEYVGDGRMAA